MADTRYLKQRRQGWYFQLAIPRDVAPKWTGANPIVQSLNTRDLSKAQVDRWPLVARCMAQFEVLRGTRQWTLEEIEEAGEREMKEALRHFEEQGTDADAAEEQADLTTDHIAESKLSEMEAAKLWAWVYAARGRAAALRGDTYTRPDTFGRLKIDPATLQPITPKATKGKGVKFEEAARRYIEETQRDPKARRTEQTKGQYEAVFRLFNSWAEAPTLDAVTRAMASDFLDAVSKLSPTWGRGPETKQRTFADIVKLYGNHGRGLSNRTLNRYATALNLVWTWAEDRGLFEGKNPWAKQQRRTGEKRKTEKLPFTTAELKKLLAGQPEVQPKRHTADTTLPWLSWIAAYSGMRLNEICSLKRDDVKRDKGVWFFDVSGAKTEAGDRRVPIHSRLIKLGLLDYREKVESEWLFPALKPGGPDDKRSWYISKAFTTHRRSLGVSRVDDTGEDRVDFHSFRRSVIATLENARVPQSEVAQVVGHERAGITFGTYNPHGLDLKSLREVVERVNYKGL
jgi:integrase